MFVFGDFSKKVKLTPREVYSDNIIFRLHHRLTFWFLLACSLLVSSRQFINSHINCITGLSEGETKVINTFCFFSTTFTVSKFHNRTLVEKNHIPHPGVGPYVDNKDEIIYHSYYQWVPFVLLLQAILFAAPHKFWRMYENHRMESLVNFMRTSQLTAPQKTIVKKMNIDSEESREEKIKRLQRTYISMSRLKVNRNWAWQLFLCECLNLLNLICQIWLLNKFLQGKFIELGYNWWHNQISSLDEVFPKVTKCTFYRYGKSGTIQNHDALCIMALNIINEKLYCIMWFWFMILLIVTALGLLWRALTYFFHYNIMFNKWIWGEISPGPALAHKEMTVVTENLCYSDWLFLYYLGKNINPSMFRKVVAMIAREIEYMGKPMQKLHSPPEEDLLESESFC